MLLTPCWPAGWIGDLIEIYLADFPFQCRFLTHSVLLAAFADCISSHFPGFHIIATDTSKDTNKTSIAAVNLTTGTSQAYWVHHMNSVFTAEALAIELGVGLAGGSNYLVLSDSMSALQALCSVSHRSPTIILHLVKVLRDVHARLDRLVLMWVQAHAGIEANEKADTLAKLDSFAICSFGDISPEDLAGYFKVLMQEEYDDWWNSCKYTRDSQYLDLRIYS